MSMQWDDFLIIDHSVSRCVAERTMRDLRIEGLVWNIQTYEVGVMINVRFKVSCPNASASWYAVCYELESIIKTYMKEDVESLKNE